MDYEYSKMASWLLTEENVMSITSHSMTDMAFSKKEPQVSSYELLDNNDRKHSDERPVIDQMLPGSGQIAPRRAGQSELFDVLFDIVLIGVPIILIIKTALCIYCYNVDKTNVGELLDQASRLTKIMIQINDQMVTIFTVVFVSIVATLMRRYALYKAQKGAYLVELEQLQSSISLPSTFKMIWKLRAWTVTSVALVCIWAFYYLGSQASKRELSLADSAGKTNIRGVTINFDAPLRLLPDDPQNRTQVAAVNRAFTTKINPMFSGAAVDTFDDWKYNLKGSDSDHVRGYVLGPLVPNLQFATSPVDTTASMDVSWSDGMFRNMFPLAGKTRLAPLTPNIDSKWYDVSSQSRNLYTSFVGRQIYLTNKTGATPEEMYYSTDAIIGKYSYGSGYFNVECDAPELLPWNAFPNGTSGNSTIAFNMTTADSSTPTDAQNNTLQRFDFWYRSFWADIAPCVGNVVLHSACSISQTYVEVEARCKAQGCLPENIQYRNGNETSATSFKTPFLDEQFASLFFSNIINSTGKAQTTYGGYGITPFGYYTGVSEYDNVIQRALNWTVNNTCSLDTDAVIMNNTIVASDISRRLSILFTSYYEVIQLYQSTLQFDVKDFFSLPYTWSSPDYALHDNLKGDDLEDAKILYGITFLKGNFYQPGYYLYWPWVALDIVSCIILFVAGILCYIIRQRTLAPDIFGYVSSLTRDNPHLSLPEIASTYTGIERANLFKNVKIKIGDVYGNDGTTQYGRIGVVRVDTEDQRAVDLRHEKRYV